MGPKSGCKFGVCAVLFPVERFLNRRSGGARGDTPRRIDKKTDFSGQTLDFLEGKLGSQSLRSIS